MGDEEPAEAALPAGDEEPAKAALPVGDEEPAAAGSELLDRWRAALPGGGRRDLVDAAGTDLLARWSEPQRCYHTLDHLRFMLSIVDAAPADQTPDRAAVRLAAWFHDAVYDPMGTDDGERTNEQRSADLAAGVLPTLGVSTALTGEVVRLVLLTADHRVTGDDANGALLVDADLAILGTPPEQYLAYARAVRAEYAHVPDAAFRAGRAAVLRQILALDQVYHLATHREAWDARARGNITAELDSLGVGQDPVLD